MKQIVLFLGLGILSSISYAQLTNSQKNQLLNDLLASMKKFESQYVCKGTDELKAHAVNKATFDSIYWLSTSRILTSSEDVVKNGKVAALEFKEAIKQLTINYSWRNANHINNIGFSAEDAGSKLFELYGKKGWKEGFTFNIGTVIPVCKQTIFFQPLDCDTLKKKREAYYIELLRKYNTVLSTAPSVINGIKSRKDANDNINFSTINSFDKIPEGITESEKQLLNDWNALQKLYKNQNSDSIIAFYKKSIGDFEVANFKKFGYSLHWLNVNLSAGLKRFSIYDTAVVSLAKINKDNLPRVTGSISYNYFRESSTKRIFYFSAEVTAGNTNYLEEIYPSEITFLQTTNSVVAIKEDFEALVVKDYAKLKKGYGYIGIGSVINYYPASIFQLKRFIGFEFGGNTKFKVFEPKGVTARDVFSVRGGLLFTFEKDKIAKSTFGLIAGLTDVPFNDVTSKDKFSVGIRIGVPFNY